MTIKILFYIDVLKTHNNYKVIRFYSKRIMCFFEPAINEMGKEAVIKEYFPKKKSPEIYFTV